MDADRLSLEAARLAKDPVFLEVLTRIRTSAVEELIRTNVDDTTRIISLQAYAKICDVFPAELEAMIKSAQPRAVLKAV